MALFMFDTFIVALVVWTFYGCKGVSYNIKRPILPVLPPGVFVINHYMPVQVATVNWVGW